MKLTLLSEANAELVAAAEYYELNRTGLSGLFLDEVDRAFRLLRRYPFSGRAVDQTIPDLCRLPLRRFPYQLIYRPDRHELLIVAIAHSSQRPGYWESRVQESTPDYVPAPLIAAGF